MNALIYCTPYILYYISPVPEPEETLGVIFPLFEMDATLATD